MGFSRPKTCRTTPSFPPVSRAWSTTSNARRLSAYNAPCNSAIRSSSPASSSRRVLPSGTPGGGAAAASSSAGTLPSGTGARRIAISGGDETSADARGDEQSDGEGVEQRGQVESPIGRRKLGAGQRVLEERRGGTGRQENAT